MDWFDFLAIQGTLKSLLQHRSSKASILRRSAFFMVQLSLTSIHDSVQPLDIDKIKGIILISKDGIRDDGKRTSAYDALSVQQVLGGWEAQNENLL